MLLFKKMDSTRAIQELGLPQTPLQETIRLTVVWYKENGYWGKLQAIESGPCFSFLPLIFSDY